MEIQVANPVNVADVSGRPDLRHVEHAASVALEILSRAIDTEPSSIFRINFEGVELIQRAAAVPICAALNGIVHTEWDKFFVLEGLSGPAAEMFETEMRDHSLVSVLMINETPQLFGRPQTIAAARGAWDHLLASREWESVTQVASAMGRERAQIRIQLERLYDNGLVFKDRESKPITYRAVGLAEDL